MISVILLDTDSVAVFSLFVYHQNCIHMNIAVFSSTLDSHDGYGTITHQLVRHLVKKGLHITLFLPKDATRQVNKFSWCDVRPVLPRYIFRVKPHSAIQYMKQLDIADAQIVHSLFAFPYCFMAARAAHRRDVPFLMGAQGTYGVLPLTYTPEKYMLRWSYGQARTVIVPSEYTKQEILRLCGKTYPIRIVHNGVDFERFDTPVDITSIRCRYAGKKILLTVGGLKSRKGQDMVIRALPHVRRIYGASVVYVLVGSGDKLEEYRQLARSCGVEDMVDFVGNKDDDALVQYFQACDIYVHTPRVVNYNFEGFGIVYLEAGACKKPVIAADAGGIRDAVIDGNTGVIVPPEDSSTLAYAIAKLLSDDATRMKMGAAGHAHAREHDWSIISQTFVNLYQMYA